jgi:hypothetical protein
VLLEEVKISTIGLSGIFGTIATRTMFKGIAQYTERETL